MIGYVERLKMSNEQKSKEILIAESQVRRTERELAQCKYETRTALEYERRAAIEVENAKSDLIRIQENEKLRPGIPFRPPMRT